MSEQSAFSLLTDLAERSRAQLLPLPESDHAQTHWTGLGCSLLARRFVAPMDEVAELMRVPPMTRLPGVKPFVYGVSNVRGRLMVVIDLAMFFGESSTIPRVARRVLAIEQEEQFIGFLIDESHGMQHFPSDAFSDSNEGVDELFAPYVRGGYQVGGTLWPIMSLTALMEHPELQKLAANS